MTAYKSRRLLVARPSSKSSCLHIPRLDILLDNFIWSREADLTVPPPVSVLILHIQAKSAATDEIPLDFRGGVRLFISAAIPYAIVPVPSSSGHAIAYRWRSLLRVRRHRASSPQGSSSNGCCCLFITTMDQ